MAVTATAIVVSDELAVVVDRSPREPAVIEIGTLLGGTNITVPYLLALLQVALPLPDQVNDYALVGGTSGFTWFRLVEVTGGVITQDGAADAAGIEMAIETGAGSGAGAANQTGVGEEHGIETGAGAGAGAGQQTATGEEHGIETGQAAGSGSGPGQAAAIGEEHTLETGQASGAGAGQNPAVGEEHTIETGTATAGTSQPGNATATGEEHSLETGQGSGSGSGSRTAAGEEHTLETGTASGSGSGQNPAVGEEHIIETGAAIADTSQPGNVTATGEEHTMETGQGSGSGSGSRTATGEEHTLETGTATATGSGGGADYFAAGMEGWTDVSDSYYDENAEELFAGHVELNLMYVTGDPQHATVEMSAQTSTDSTLVRSVIEKTVTSSGTLTITYLSSWSDILEVMVNGVSQAVGNMPACTLDGSGNYVPRTMSMNIPAGAGKTIQIINPQVKLMNIDTITY
jgi:hypothetical protein